MASNNHRNRIVELQGDDGRSSAGSHADHASSLGAPAKIVVPALLARVEERHPMAGFRIDESRLSGLEVVAEATCKPKVFVVVLAVCRSGVDVLNLQPTENQMLWAQAIATTIPGLTPNSITHCR